MARIPEAEIERLKAEVSVERLAEARGIRLERHGTDLIGLCPFHDDHEPSLVITPGKNLWHCLGACRAGGSVIDWVMKSRGMSFRHAVELLRADHPSLAAPGKIVRKATTVKLEAPFARDDDDQRVLCQVVDYYHETVNWIMDNGSSHRGERSDKRLRDRWRNIVPVHTPVHASRLNQVMVYFSVVQRKVLTPNDFDSLASVEDRPVRFQEFYQESARPFQWKFTRHDLAQLLA
jgi:hypothetical protein